MKRKLAGNRTGLFWQRCGAEENTAFTLIELLVVIAVIAILAVLLLPALSRAKAQAKSISCKNHLRQMEVALQLYTGNDSHNRFPYSQVETDGPWYMWEDEMAPYYPLNWTNPAYHCPGYTGWIQYLPVVNGQISVAGGPVGSYGYNACGSAGPFETVPLGLGFVYDTARENSIWAALNLPAVTESQVVAPSEMIAFADSGMAGVSDSQLASIAAAGFTYVPGAYAKGAGWSPIGGSVLFCSPTYLAPPGASSLDPRSFPPRHGSNYNLACCDGHVEGMRPNRLFSPQASAVRWNNDHQPHPETWTWP